MVSILLSWIFILYLATPCGILFLKILYADTENHCNVLALQNGKFGIDIVVATGVMVLTIYAEAFSILYRVGALALVVITVIATIIYLYILVSNKEKLHDAILANCRLKIPRSTHIIKGVLVILIVYSMVALTNCVAGAGDSYLYHIQSIYWIEKYGVVKGIANLHHRFGYNSAFLSLQALFSFNSLIGQQLHTVNGFLCCAMLIYSVMTNNLLKSTRKICISDWAKISVIIYVILSRDKIGVPNTDTMAMLIVFYLVIKWAEYSSESDRKDIDYLCILCVLGVFGVTVKLSIAPCVLLAVYPVVIYIKNGDWQKLFKNVLICVAVGLPWLIRNVIISGYLVYPFTGIDIFDFEWKVSKTFTIKDKYEIEAWGRKTFDIATHDWTFSEWFPCWWNNSRLSDRVLLILGVVAIFALIVRLVASIYTSRTDRLPFQTLECMLEFFIIASFAFWFISAPDTRFGIVYILCAIACVIGDKDIPDSVRFVLPKICIIMSFACFIWIFIFSGGYRYSSYLVMQRGYAYYKTRLIELNGWSAYTCDDVESGVDVFPYVPYEDNLYKVEMLGSDISDGFKLKEEYKDINYLD